MDSSATPEVNPLDLLPALPKLDSTFGAFLLGTFFSLILYGICVYQGYTYLRVRRKESMLINILVVLVLVFDALHMTLLLHCLYHYLVTNYSKPQALKEAIWSLNLIPPFGMLVVCASQFFFARRISLISRKHAVLAVIAVLSLMGTTSCTVVITVKGFTSGSTEFATNDQLFAGLAFGFAIVTAVSITGSLISVLMRVQRSQVGSLNSANNRSYSLSDKWIIFGVNTGSLILVVDIVCFVLALALPGTLYWAMFYMVSVRLDAITLFSVLNSRQSNSAHGHLESGKYDRHVIARANRLAAIERYNVPRLPEEELPGIIDIRVTTEVEGEPAGSALSLVEVTRSEKGDESMIGSIV